MRRVFCDICGMEIHDDQYRLKCDKLVINDMGQYYTPAFQEYEICPFCKEWMKEVILKQINKEDVCQG